MGDEAALSLGLAGGQFVVTVSSRASELERFEFPSTRWFAAALSSEIPDDDGEIGSSTQIATCEAVLISLKHGLREAYLDAEAEEGSLAAVMEGFVELDRRHLLSRLYPDLSAVVFIDTVTVPDAHRGHGHGARIVRELADYFDYLPDTTLLAAYPTPDGAEQMDPFTFRIHTQRLEKILSALRMKPLGKTGAWCATVSTLRADRHL